MSGFRVLQFFLLLLFAVSAQAAPQFPRLTGRVVDAANILPPATEAALDARLAGLEQRDGTQLVVATVPSLQDYDIADYGYQLGRAWGIGQKGRNNGAILLVAPNERKVRIEVGYGLEPVLTDAMTSVIIQQTILPRFKAGDMPGGIEAGADAIIGQLGLTPAEAHAAAQRAAEAQAARGRDNDEGVSIHAFVWLVIIGFWILSAIFRRRGRRYRSGIGGALPMILWAASQGGRGGGGWGGGGGFSGGGGSFGGGGSSGSW
jgi:uncharacterized protein